MTTHSCPVASVDSQIARHVLGHVVLSTMSQQVKSNNITNNFTAILIEEDDKFITQCKEIPYIYGQGNTKEESIIDLQLGISDELAIAINDISLNLELYYD